MGVWLRFIGVYGCPPSHTQFLEKRRCRVRAMKNEPGILFLGMIIWLILTAVELNIPNPPAWLEAISMGEFSGAEGQRIGDGGR
jgi:hypothetical protein